MQPPPTAPADTGNQAGAQTCAPTEPALALHFTEWQCGHHPQPPADIPVSSIEQALQVLGAISCAISQPGHARALLLRGEWASSPIYLTDDYVYPAATTEKLAQSFLPRPVLYHGDAATVAALYDPALARALDEDLCMDLRPWSGKMADPVQCCEDRTTTLTPEQVTQLIEQQALDYPTHLPTFDGPPVFKPAADLLAELREATESWAACQAELAAEGAVVQEGGAA